MKQSCLLLNQILCASFLMRSPFNPLSQRCDKICSFKGDVLWMAAMLTISSSLIKVMFDLWMYLCCADRGRDVDFPLYPGNNQLASWIQIISIATRRPCFQHKIILLWSGCEISVMGHLAMCIPIYIILLNMLTSFPLLFPKYWYALCKLN